MIDYEIYEPRVENAIAIIDCGIMNGIENLDKVEMYAELQRGFGELLKVAYTIGEDIDGEANDNRRTTRRV